MLTGPSVPPPQSRTLSPPPPAPPAPSSSGNKSATGVEEEERPPDTPAAAAAAAAASQPAASSSAGDLTWRRSRSSFRLRASLFLLAMGLPGNLYVLHCYWSPGEEGEKNELCFFVSLSKILCPRLEKNAKYLFNFFVCFTQSRPRPPSRSSDRKSR